MTQNNTIRNEHLEGDDFYWKAGPTGILLIHGFTATTAEVRLIAKKCHTDGFTTAAPLLPGHGTHPDQLNQTRWQDWLQKVEETYSKLSRDCDSVFVIAESMGTLLALALAAKNPNIKGLMLFAPAIKINGLWRARLMAPFINHIEKNAKDDGLPWKGYTVYPVKGSVALLKLQKFARKQLPKITQPLLVFTGAEDHTIHPNSAKIILDNVQSEAKAHQHMKNSAHCILLDKELDAVYEKVRAFIEQHDPLTG
jgi:carboxylesterase